MPRVECYDEGKAVGDLLSVIVHRDGKIRRYLFDGEFSKEMLTGGNDNNPGIIVNAFVLPRRIIGYFNFGNWEIVTDEQAFYMYLRDKCKKAIGFNPCELIASQNEMFLFNYLEYESFDEANEAFIKGLKEKYKIPDGIIRKFLKWIFRLFKKKISK